jgi:SP family myo-inositol transporter-like MFS transporter 13
MMDLFTPVGTFALYALVCVAALVAIYRIYPETAGLSLEDVGGLLKDGWGVEESVRRAKVRRRVVREGR